MSQLMYEVAIHEHGKILVRGGMNNPCEGLLSENHRWTKITKRPIGLERAKKLATAQVGHAVVCVWRSSELVYDNGKPPSRPAEWWPVSARTSLEPRT